MTAASTPRAVVRLLALTALTTVLLPVYLACLPFGPRARRAVSWTWFRGCCVVAGLRIRAAGVPATGRPVLFVANHVSYLDVPVLGALIDGVFVAKSDVATWPVIGPLARLVGTVFVARRPSQARTEAAELGRRIVAGQSLVVFPEGTSSDGSRVLPFKSPLFALAVPADGGDGEMPVQPVAVAYTRARDGRPLDARTRPLFAWFGDMALVPHLWTLLGLDGVTVEVRFLPPVQGRDFAGRKPLAAYCRTEVAAGVGLALARAASARGTIFETARVAPIAYWDAA